MPNPVVVSAGDIDWDALAGAEAGAAPVETNGLLVAPSPQASAGPARSEFSQRMQSLTPAQRQALARRAEDSARGKGRIKVEDGDENLWGFPSFLMGFTLSLAGALIGAALWLILLKATGMELRPLAWVIGLLAGGGMFAGYQKHDMGAAAIAAIFAGGGIVLAKCVIALWSPETIIQQQLASSLKEAEQAVENYYENDPARHMDEKDRFLAAYNFAITRKLHDEGISAKQWSETWDWDQDKILVPLRLEIHELGDVGQWDLIRRSHLFGEMQRNRVQDAHDKFKEENALTFDHPDRYFYDDYYSDTESPEVDAELAALEAEADVDGDGTLGDGEYEALYKKRQELMKTRREAWAGFEDAETEAEALAWADLDALSVDDVLEAYRASLNEQRELELAFLEGQKNSAGKTASAIADNLASRSEEEQELIKPIFIVSAFSAKDIIYIPLALITAFGLACGLRAGD